MSRISGFEVFAVDLPFRRPFKHAAAERESSYSIFLKCRTDTGTVGFGECLPRDYVTGESRGAAFRLLRDHILPRLIGKEFQCMEDLESFLLACDGKTPGWVPPDVPQTATWAAVDLALTDTFGREFQVPALGANPPPLPANFRYSGALSSDRGVRLVLRGLIKRLYGIRQVKLKVDSVPDEGTVHTVRRIFGRNGDIRVDANMAWTLEQALDAMDRFAQYGVRSFEQPLRADDIEGMATLVARTGLGVMADESLNDRESLERLIRARACTAVNVRISKCGGLTASMARAREALDAGLVLQLGCQVGESSLLSAAQLALARHVQPVTYAEGCFGHFLLREDPVSPALQFGYAGRPPAAPAGPGLGVSVNEDILRRFIIKAAEIG